jgi:hypothetical protein
MIYDIVFWAFAVTVVVVALHLFYDFLVAPLLRDVLRSLVVKRRALLIERCREDPGPVRQAATARLLSAIERTDKELRTVTLRSLSKLSVNPQQLDEAEFQVEEAGPDFVRAAMDVKMAVFAAAVVNTGMLLFYSVALIFPFIFISDEVIRMWQQANRNAEGIAFGVGAA